MNPTKRASKLVSVFGRLFLYLLCGAFALYLGITYYSARKTNQQLQERYKVQKRTLENIKTRNSVLAEKRRRLRSDPEAIERILREEYGMLKPNEYRIVE